jgi:hypothetical protein
VRLLAYAAWLPSRPFPPGGVQLTIKNKLLPKGRLWATFDSMAQAESYAKQLEGLLAQGVVPSSLLERTTAGREIWRRKTGCAP